MLAFGAKGLRPGYKVRTEFLWEKLLQKSLATHGVVKESLEAAKRSFRVVYVCRLSPVCIPTESCQICISYTNTNPFFCFALSVEPHSIIYTPEKLYEDLRQEHPGLGVLMENQLNQLSEGVLMFSRSWAVDVGLPENPNVICDALLIAMDRPPILYTVSKHPVSELLEYSRQIAWRLKEKLVNTGGYIHKLCIIPQLLLLPPQTERGTAWGPNVQEMYPQRYSLIHSGNLAALLRALTVALLTFRSFLSDHVGFEFLNLLTMKQYQLLSENLHKTKKLFVYGLPGTGKTIVALKIIEKIRHMLQCTPQEVLYVCENQPLRDFVR